MLEKTCFKENRLLKNSYEEFKLDLIELHSLQISSVDERILGAFKRASLLENLVLEKILYGPLIIDVYMGFSCYFSMPC